MNIAKSLADYLEAQDVATFGQDMFISRAPASNSYDAASGTTIPQNIWWLVASGGFKVGVFDTYNVDIYYRDHNAEQVYAKLQSLSDSLVAAGPIDLEGFDVIRAEAQGFHADQDIDNEERTVGLLQVTIFTYKGTPFSGSIS